MLSKIDASAPFKRADTEAPFIRLQLLVEFEHTANLAIFRIDGSRRGIFARAANFRQMLPVRGEPARLPAQVVRIRPFHLQEQGLFHPRGLRRGGHFLGSTDCSQRSDLVIEFESAIAKLERTPEALR